MKGRRRLVLALLAVAGLTAFGVLGLGTAQTASGKPSAVPSCNLNNGIKHVIYVQFDNTHFLRDNGSVPSDLQQMPHLLNFLRDNGTLLTNDHTVLISHTAGGILSSLTGLYPDRNGQAVSNSYGYFRNTDQGVNFSSSFKYWTDATDGGNAAANPPAASTNPSYNMVTPDPATGAPKNTPAPWVPWTRAGCDVGNVGTANAVLENNSSIVLRPAAQATTLAAPASIGATNIKVASVAGLSPGQTIVIETGTANAELAVISNVGTAGPGGTGVDLTQGLTNAHASGKSVTVTATDAAGDMTKVFGQGSPEWNEGRASQISQGGTAARALAQTDFVGIAVHCGAGGGICNSNSHARPDTLPDEPGGYGGFQGLFGAKYVNPAICAAPGATCTNATSNGQTAVLDTFGNPIVDPFTQPGFPGFDGMFAATTLSYVAQMQESGIPVTYAYISDAHDGHGVSGNIHFAYAPGEAGYVQQLHDYDQAFASFFNRLAADGINKSNTLFVFTVDEGDHFVGDQPNAPCDGVTVPCTYNRVGEINADLRRMVITQYGDTTNFSVHSDDAPNVYVAGNPGRTAASVRTLEREMSQLHWTNPYTGTTENGIMVAQADPVQERILRMVTADQQRTPTFTPFADPNWFFFASSNGPGNTPPPVCPSDAACASIPARTSQSFAWNHGDIQQEIATTWAGVVGPGVENRGEYNGVWTDHTDLRPTINTLAGLHDDYVSDGRVVTQILHANVLPSSLKGREAELGVLGEAYKQLTAPFGSFAMDTLQASTVALASNTAGDAKYTCIENQLIDLSNQRDALVADIRNGLDQAEFNGVKLSKQQLNDWTNAANALNAQAATAGSSC
ncbi:MAG: hypothetical protein WBB76_06650 [Gaiellaceae bacterium]